MAVPNDRQCGRSPTVDRFCHARDGIFTYVYANEAATASGVAESKAEGTREQRCTKLFRAPPTIDTSGKMEFVSKISALEIHRENRTVQKYLTVINIQ